jgi:hypothetical protein
MTALSRDTILYGGEKVTATVGALAGGKFGLENW